MSEQINTKPPERIYLEERLLTWPSIGGNSIGEVEERKQTAVNEVGEPVPAKPEKPPEHNNSLLYAPPLPPIAKVS